MQTENLSTLKIHKLTQAQYDRELDAGNIDETALYLTPDEAIDLTPYVTIEQLDTKADAEHVHSEYVSSAQVSAQITNAINEITPNSIGALPEVLTSEHYGYSLPSAGTIGRIFFKRVVE